MALVALLVVAAAGVLVAWSADSDRVDTLAGTVTGATTAFALFAAALLLWQRRARRAAHDEAALDALEPLRGAGPQSP